MRNFLSHVRRCVADRRRVQQLVFVDNSGRRLAFSTVHGAYIVASVVFDLNLPDTRANLRLHLCVSVVGRDP